MIEAIKKLTELQVVDLKIAKLDAEKKSEQVEIDRRVKSLEERKASIVELEERMAGIEARRRGLDAELIDELGRIKERQSKMMQVQTNREYQSLLKEIEDGKKHNKDREDEVIQLAEQHDALAKILAEQIKLCGQEEEALAADSKEQEKNASDLGDKKAVILQKREAMAKGIDPGMLRKYDLIRQRRNGMAVAGVTNGVCQGCFMSIPPQLFNEIIRGDKLIACPTCQRIMYHLEQAEA